VSFYSVKYISHIGQIFTHVTLQMSKSSTPTLPWVLPMYEHMLKHFTATRDAANILQPLHIAAAAGLDKLKVYYEKARGCQFNVVGTRTCLLLDYFDF
jgi:DhnA family fructose-bisphosphate aldolase class Ia